MAKRMAQLAVLFAVPVLLLVGALPAHAAGGGVEGVNGARHRGEAMTLSGYGLGPNCRPGDPAPLSRIRLRWNGTVMSSFAITGAGTDYFNGKVTVPSGATIGRNNLDVQCLDPATSAYAVEAFGYAYVRTESVSTARARRGAAVSFSARYIDDVACARYSAPGKSWRIAWDGAELPLRSSSMQREPVSELTFQRFSASFAVPANASIGSHRLAFQCVVTGGFAAAAFYDAWATTFTVLADPSSPPVVLPPSQSPSPGASPSASVSQTPAVSATPPDPSTSATPVAGQSGGASAGWPRPRQIDALPRWRDHRTDLGWAAVLWVIVLLLSLLLIGFPAELFNSTFEENEERIRRWLRLRPVRVPKPSSATWPVVASFALVSAVLMTFGERGQIWPETALVTGLALLIAVPVVAVGYVFAAESYERRVTGTGAARLRIAYPALAVALIMAVISHFAQFVPGYVYGLVLAYAAVEARQLTRRQEAVGVLRGAVVLLVVGVLSWAAWQFVTSGLPDRTAFGPRLFDTVFGFIVIMCCETLVVGLLPLRFLDGRKVWRWGRAGKAVWAVVFSTSVCLLTIALYGLGSRTDTVEIARRMAWLFGIFAAISVVFWLFFVVVNRVGRRRSARR